MGKAIGMIETQGLVSSIEAADAMIKASKVEIVSQELVDGGIVTVIVQGDVGAVQAAVDAGKETVTRMNGQLLSAHVIPRADDSVYNLIQLTKQAAKPAPRKTKTTEAKKKKNVEKQD